MTARPGVGAGLARLGRLIRKELSESLRDRRTILTLVLMPMLLYPVLAMAFQQLLLSGRAESDQPTYRLAFASEDEARAVLGYLGLGQLHQEERHAPPRARGKEPTRSPYLEPTPQLQARVSSDGSEMQEAVRQGLVDLGIGVSPPGLFRADPRRPLAIDVELYLRQGSPTGQAAARYVEGLLADANASHLGRVFQAARLEQRGDPVRARVNALPDDAGKRSSLVPVLVPLILILMTMTGAVYPAIDLTAGERERGTLEILVAAPIPRLSVLLAKYVAVLTVAMLTALVNLGMMALTLQVTGIGPALFGPGLTVLTFVQVLVLLLLFAAFFSAVLLTLTSFARSFKEAQAYLIPLMLLCLTPGMLALMPGLSLSSPLAIVPLINIVLLSRDVFEGAASPGIAAIVVLTTLLYALAAIGLATRIFGTEAVLSNEASGWGDLFRRPLVARDVAEPSGALLCLAILFPIYFLVSSGVAQLSGLDLTWRLLLGGVLNVLLFGCIPLLAALLGNVRLVSGFRLRLPGWQACAVGLLLGAGLWPFVHELVLLAREAGFATLRPEVRERIADLLVQWRSLSPLVIVGAMAVVPAVVEEWFFRGYLLSALLGGHPGERGTGRLPVVRAVVGSAVLFALFHLLVSDALAVERLVPSLLLGLVLGWLAYASGSVVPGMLLHLVHNGTTVLLGYHEPWLLAEGWLREGQEHYPAWLLGTAAVPAVVGLAWLGRMSRRKAVGA